MFARIGVMRALKRHVERRVRSIAQGHPLGPPEWRATDDERIADALTIRRLVELGLKAKGK